MPEPFPSTKSALIKAVDEAWAELHAFLRSLTEENTSRQDDNGWTVKDHATHIAVWEDSVAVLFRGKQRHEALGIDEAFYKEATFDQINAIVKERYSHLRLGEAVALLTQVHDALMAEVQALSEVQLTITVRDFFPQAPREDDRRMMDFIYWNTADHFTEHLPWMRGLTSRAA
jgi:hypothetical protein